MKYQVVSMILLATFMDAQTVFVRRKFEKLEQGEDVTGKVVEVKARSKIECSLKLVYMCKN